MGALMGSSGTSSSKEGSLGLQGGAKEAKVELKGPGFFLVGKLRGNMGRMGPFLDDAEKIWKNIPKHGG